MGVYLNPGNNEFAEALLSEYVDKTELIALINSTISTKQKLTCVSRPRRFGKSYAAQMLCAYYGKGEDSHPLFKDLKIAQNEDYETHLNKYDVIYLDMTNNSSGLYCLRLRETHGTDTKRGNTPRVPEVNSRGQA